MQWDDQTHTLVGPGGSVALDSDDEVTQKLAMLIAGGLKVHLSCS